MGKYFQLACIIAYRPEPTQVEQLAGILRACILIILSGTALTFGSIIGKSAAEGWPLSDLDGYIPGVFEPTRREVPQDFGGHGPVVLSMTFALCIGTGFYLALGGYFLGGIFMSVLLTGKTLPSYPILYFIAAITVIVGVVAQDWAERKIRSSKWYRGY